MATTVIQGFERRGFVSELVLGFFIFGMKEQKAI